MRVRVGHEISIRVTQPTPLICMVAPEVSRHRDFIGPEMVSTNPHVPIHNYYDRYNNICRRIVAPAGDFTLRGDVTLQDSGDWDEVNPAAQELRAEDLPDEVMGFLTASRYVESDLVSQEAWDLFGNVTPGWTRVQTVVDHVNGLLTFDYGTASVYRTAAGARQGGIGVCRDFAHLALAYLRALNIPARYVNGYVGDIGVPKVDAPMDFAAWTEVYLSGKWYTFDPRNNERRIGRVVVARGHDAADVPLMNSFGAHELTGFTVWCHPVDEQGSELDGMLFGK
ncbi:transglutaminase family protein [Paracoccus liaowanqingii]|uniref:Transglutaminase family protein n=1 Tax=Paracoccus liaowanqingii TaxID=2560053 RepID=A0A4Z1CS40_9RHOB|nr:transglutaminase family protein [Paracoccus liaowanqingii]TGN68132.1 transglutaminase family protein [Paracoccus liaowanqingii]